jgi:hypothetical protein
MKILVHPKVSHFSAFFSSKDKDMEEICNFTVILFYFSIVLFHLGTMIFSMKITKKTWELQSLLGLLNSRNYGQFPKATIYTIEPTRCPSRTDHWLYK